ncbi:hypothetical protein M885DRAFT_466619 [Pelagophyceae sp. CCMP2097]|nr:hypothetical protein M885DRAFT_466619 [Pelagophyceae sp. CCMP2097]|mmetsp:Transcript_8450/g.27799  ORF Transcript_8450/g.27799 Transcript_8450/m.27799 type:complete len:353 (-) Transcript_8450:140-1198(-)
MQVPTWAFALFFAGRFFLGWVLDTPLDSAASGAPILESLTEHALELPAFNRLKHAVLGVGGLAHSKWSKSNQLSQGFKRTNGFVLRFNVDGADRAFAGDFAPLRPFWEMARRKEDNAFVLNMVYVAPAVCAADVEDEAFSIALHVDETVAIESHRVFFADSVSVLYLESSPNAIGGELQLFDVARGQGEKMAARGVDERPDAAIRPKPNRLAVFRGNALHRVTHYCVPAQKNECASKEGVHGRPAESCDSTTGEAARVSLVLESYRIPPRYYGATIPFEVLGGEDHRSYERRSAGVAKLIAGVVRWRSGSGVVAQSLHGTLLAAAALLLIAGVRYISDQSPAEPTPSPRNRK